MRILVLVSGYPSFDNIYNCTWAHTRSIAYLNNGITPIILNFGADAPYEYERVKVYSKYDQKELLQQDFDIVISHSPNIRNHFSFIEELEISKLKKIFLFCHGTESMYINFDYPKPYPFMKKNFYQYWVRNLYDFSKFFVFRNFVKKYKNKLHIVFVSNWMKNIFEKNVMSISDINFSIINNAISNNFLIKNYSLSSEKKADFITIRKFDESKYAIDLVVQHAMNNLDKTYHIYGKGDFFMYYDQPKNLKIFNHFIRPEDIPELLDNYTCALMPTRCDAQGVMVCEMATYGIPVISTNIDVNQEILSSYSNVILLDEKEFSQYMPFDNIPSCSQQKNHRFSNQLTVNQEIKLFLEVNHA